LRHKRRNGETYPVQAHIQLLVLEEQKKVVVFATDITQQVQAEKEQRR
jgi:PAS domain S-box-containing protein